MTKRTVANNFLYYIFCGFSGAVTSLIVWLFLKLMGLGIGLVWDTIPSNFDFKFYPIIVCTAGGIILGIWQKLTNAVPDELDEVMKKVKKDKFYPYNKVLLLCISALLPLVFGGSLGPEAGLTGVIVGLCYWAGSHMKDAKSKIPELMQIGISATLSAVFYAPLFGLASVNEERLDSEEKPTDIRSTKLISNIIAVLLRRELCFCITPFSAEVWDFHDSGVITLQILSVCGEFLSHFWVLYAVFCLSYLQRFSENFSHSFRANSALLSAQLSAELSSVLWVHTSPSQCFRAKKVLPLSRKALPNLHRGFLLSAVCLNLFSQTSA